MFQFFVHGVSLERDKIASSSYCEGNSQNDHLFIDLQLNKFSKQLKSNSWKATSKKREYHGLHAVDKTEDILILCISQPLCSWFDNNS